MRVLLVDDHAIVREGLKRVLASMGDGVQVGEATNAARALHLARKAEWDCALVDIALPGKTGLELLKELTRETGAALMVIPDGGHRAVFKAARPDFVRAALAFLGG